MATVSLAGLTPDTAEAVRLLLAYAESRGIRASVVSAKRSCAYQDSLYAQGRTAPGPIVTNAKGCNSWHVLGRAVDLTIQGGSSADYATLADYWKGLGGGWGGDFKGPSAALKDIGHYEYHPGLKYAAEVCGEGCQINEAANAPKFWPEDKGTVSSDGSSGSGWLLFGLAAVAIGAGVYFGRNGK